MILFFLFRVSAHALPLFALLVGESSQTATITAPVVKPISSEHLQLAQASTRQRKTSPNTDSMSLVFDSGGPAGCIHDNVTDDQRRMLERLGGRPCATPASQTRKAPTTTQARPWVVGSWVAQGAYCASGDPVRFGADGSYTTGGGEVQGRYKYLNGSMSVTYSEVDFETGRGGTKKRSTVKVVRTGPNDMTYGRDRMKRCPPRGGREPWHPSTTFQTE